MVAKQDAEQAKSRFIGVRLQPQAQSDLSVLLEIGQSESITEAVHKALQVAAKAAKRKKAA